MLGEVIRLLKRSGEVSSTGMVGAGAGAGISKAEVWKYPSSIEDVYKACELINLKDGFIISENPRVITEIGSESTFQSFCYRNMLLLSTTNTLFEQYNITKLPYLDKGWDYYVDHDFDSIYCIYPIIYSLSSCFVVTLFLTLIILTKQYLYSQKPTRLIKISSFLALLYLSSTYIFSIVKFYEQYEKGISSGMIVTDAIQGSPAFNSVDLVVTILLQFAQVQIIMRTFSRQKEKRIVLVIGVFLAVSSQALMATYIATRHLVNYNSDEDSTITIIPVFVYLLRISMSVLFSSLMFVFIFSKKNFIFSNSKILVFTLITFAAINASILFFFADVAVFFISQVSEVFNITCYVVSNVVSWEYINRIALLEKNDQKKGILGRPFYIDEATDYFDSFGNYLPKIQDQDKKNNLKIKKFFKKGKYDFIITSHDKIEDENDVDDLNIYVESMDLKNNHHNNYSSSLIKNLELRKKNSDNNTIQSFKNENFKFSKTEGSSDYLYSVYNNVSHKVVALIDFLIDYGAPGTVSSTNDSLYNYNIDSNNQSNGHSTLTNVNMVNNIKMDNHKKNSFTKFFKNINNKKANININNNNNNNIINNNINAKNNIKNKNRDVYLYKTKQMILNNAKLKRSNSEKSNPRHSETPTNSVISPDSQYMRNNSINEDEVSVKSVRSTNHDEHDNNSRRDLEEEIIYDDKSYCFDEAATSSNFDV